MCEIEEKIDAPHDPGCGSVHHRVVNELTVIRSAAEILRDVREIEDADQERFVAVVLVSERRLEALVKELR